MSDEFGDFEADDAYAEEPADPEQIAVRMHELRAYLAEVAGEDLVAWDSLSAEEQQIAVALGQSVVGVIVTDPDNVPQGFHEVMVYLSEQPEWDELDEDAQAVATAIMDDILEWLKRQGSTPTEA